MAAHMRRTSSARARASGADCIPLRRQITWEGRGKEEEEEEETKCEEGMRQAGRLRTLKCQITKVIPAVLARAHLGFA